MQKPIKVFIPWLTPKIFADFSNPAPRVAEFFDHYVGYIDLAQTLVVNFAAGNGDQVLCYGGKERWEEEFDWARYNWYKVNQTPASVMDHNLDWLKRVRDGGERSANPYLGGPCFTLSEQKLNYRLISGIYQAFRDEATRRGVNLKLLEYIEPGPEFCKSVWKDQRHPENYAGVDNPVKEPQEVMDVTGTLRGDAFSYASFPEGLPEGTNTGAFVAAQCAAYVQDFQLDGILLGNQFGLKGFWHPDNALPSTPARREGIRSFFQGLRQAMGDRLIYWMDSYWPAEVEMDAWSMSEENYHLLDGVLCSNFAVIAERTQVVPNLESKLRVASRNPLGKPDVLFTMDFVDPWYVYRVYLDDRKNFVFQHDIYQKHAARLQGISFFANDTFGHFVFREPLDETLQAIRSAHAVTD